LKEGTLHPAAFREASAAAKASGIPAQVKAQLTSFLHFV
jgi:hypothetical protein